MGKRKVFIRRKYSDSVRWRIACLGDYGLHGKAIARICSTPACEVTVSAVYTICKQHGVRLRDYRDGLGSAAMAVIDNSKREGKING